MILSTVKKSSFVLLLVLSIASFGQEKHLKNIKQLTFGGDNAEAYFSPKGDKLTLQVTNKAFGVSCDQIFMLDLQAQEFNEKSLQLVSTGKGRTTCSYYMPDGKHIYMLQLTQQIMRAQLHLNLLTVKYLWAIYPEFDIYIADLNGNITKQLTNSPGYDAEAVVSPDGKKIAFTSIRSGDLELYTMNIDGSNVTQITDELGYDGGAFFSPDGTQIIFRSSRPKTPEAIEKYKTLLADGLVEPTEMELFICNADGSDRRQLTRLGNANWSPFFHPSGDKILFSSNFEAERGFPFNLYMIDTDGKNLTRITQSETFDAFPVFSNDGKYLVFS